MDVVESIQDGENLLVFRCLDLLADCISVFDQCLPCNSLCLSRLNCWKRLVLAEDELESKEGVDVVWHAGEVRCRVWDNASTDESAADIGVLTKLLEVDLWGSDWS